MEVSGSGVIFSYKDYRAGGKKKSCRLSGVEFLRRFSSHILPRGFVRIRHYGILASRNKSTELNQAKASLSAPAWEPVKLSWLEVTANRLNYQVGGCPICKTNTMETVKVILPERGPPGYG